MTTTPKEKMEAYIEEKFLNKKKKEAWNELLDQRV